MATWVEPQPGSLRNLGRADEAASQLSVEDAAPVRSRERHRLIGGDRHRRLPVRDRRSVFGTVASLFGRVDSLFGTVPPCSGPSPPCSGPSPSCSGASIP